MKHSLILLFCTLFFVSMQAQPGEEEKYDSLKTAYLKGKKNYSSLPWIINQATELKQTDFARTVAMDYINNYLSKAPIDQFLSATNIDLLIRYNNTTENNAFKRFYQHAASVDSVMNEQRFSEGYIDRTIAHMEIEPAIGKEYIGPGSPKWNNIENKLSAKFDKQTANRAVLKERIQYYERAKDTSALIVCYTGFFDRYGIDTSRLGRMIINNVNYFILFRHSEDTAVLGKACGWAEQVVHMDPDNGSMRDTYANLLYKIGQKDEAMRNEARAMQDAPRDAEIQSNFQKMKRGEKTW